MPIVAASNGVRPELRALGVIKLLTPVTPAEINAHVGTGDYAAKYISFLKTRYGFTFSCQKQGRTIVSYTLLGEPANVAELRGAQPKQKAVKAPKAKAAKPAKVTVPAVTKTKAVKKAAASFMAKRKADAVTKQFGTSGEVSSYGVDADWDSMEGINVRDLVA